ncbi:MAG: DEAD/DEAH box helicase [Bacteroidota bacterium]
MQFKELNLDSRLLEGIDAIGFNETTPIQEQAIPPILAGKDIIGSAQTGTGKTAAFLLPIINNIITTEQKNSIKALVIVPTRELASQIDQQLEGFSYFTPISSVAIYGGTDGAAFSRERQALAEGADIVICTPGRMIAHLNMGNVSLSGLKYLVLDEADRMLDMGFFEDIMQIISYLPKERQNLMFAATMPKEIRDLARKILVDPVEISIAISKPSERVLQGAYVVYETQKIPLLLSLLSARKLQSILIFCSTKSSTKILNRELRKTGLAVSDIHSDLTQDEREQVLLDFRNRKLNILVATDILSRGIDIEDIDLVINYDVPNDGEDYIHRIGRTARAASEGVALTFINDNSMGRFGIIERLLGSAVFKIPVPAEFGEAPVYNPDKKSGGFKRGNAGKKPSFRHSRR